VHTVDLMCGNQATLNWLLYDGHGSFVRTLAPSYALSAFQWRGVWSEVQSSPGTGRGYCANLGHPEDETGCRSPSTREMFDSFLGGDRYGTGNPAYDGMNSLTRFGGAAIQHDLLGNRLQGGQYLHQ
jgi:hypothetical protein